MILFLTTRHSFIRKVALSRGGPQVLVTTQRVTVREETGLNYVELDGIKSEASIHTPPITPKSYLASFEDSGVYMGGIKEEASEVGNVQKNSETEITVNR